MSTVILGILTLILVVASFILFAIMFNKRESKTQFWVVTVIYVGVIIWAAGDFMASKLG